MLCNNAVQPCTSDENFRICRDVADILGDCQSELCTAKVSAINALIVAVIISTISILSDSLQLIPFFKYKLLSTIGSSAIKFVAIGILVIYGTSSFINTVNTAYCFNTEIPPSLISAIYATFSTGGIVSFINVPLIVLLK